MRSTLLISTVFLIVAGACKDAVEPVPRPPPPPPPPPVGLNLNLSTDNVSFDDTLGGSTSPTLTVSITSIDSIEVAGTSVAVGLVSYDGGVEGWLTYQMDRSTTPAVLSLQPYKVGLDPGNYTATVSIMSDAAVNSPTMVTVRLNLVAEPPAPPDPPPSEPPPGPIPGVTIVAAGNIAKCGSSLAIASANAIQSVNPDFVFAMGDNVYPPGAPPEQSATLADFENCYGPTWGRFKAITYAAVGGREQDSLGFSTGADAYFGPDRVGPAGRNYYSFNLGTWHIIVLNVQSGGNSTPVPYGSGSEQLAWLQQDLAANSGAQCTLAFWHLPMWYSSSNTSSADVNIAYRRQTQRGMWSALHAANVDVVLGGGDHIYERFAPMRYVNNYPEKEFEADPVRGIRQFTSGLGGDGPLANPRVNVRHELSQYRSGGNGVLKLVLGEGQYTWQFINTQYSSVQDWGTGTCH